MALSLLRMRSHHRLRVVDVSIRETPLRVALRSFFVVVLFWWSATGVIFALERSPATRWLGLALATLCAAWGGTLLWLDRDEETPSAARRSFLGGAFLWTWAQVAFYGGWIVGPTALMVPIPAEAPTFSLALRAIGAMLWYQLVMLGVLGAAAALTARRRNRVGWWALCLFWCVHQIASINIFLGVENPGRGFFPPPLAFLESYFGPQRNSWFLPVSLAVILAFSLRVIVHALRDPTPHKRQSMMLLAVIGVLSVFELAVLGAPLTVPLWDSFLAVRGY